MPMEPSLVQSLSNWIAATSLSDAFKAHSWIVPTSQSIHLLAVSVVFVCALLIGLRLLGLSRSEQTLSMVIRRLTRLMYAGHVVLLMTGAVQTIAEPDRQFGSPAFWIKMLLIVLGLLMTYLLARSTQSNPHRWDSADHHPARLRIYGAIYVSAWTAIIFCGRFIGYT